MTIRSKLAALAALAALLFVTFAASAQVSIVLTQGGVEKTCTTLGDVIVSGGQVRAAVADGCLTVQSGGANETPTAYNVTVTTSGSGAVVSAPAGINCGIAGASCSASFSSASSVTLTATPSSGWNFSAWQGCGSVSGATCTVTMTNHRSVVATFTAQSSGGAGAVDPGSMSWSPNLAADPLVVVVGQSGISGTTSTIVPGCVNGGAVDFGASCRGLSEYEATINGTKVTARLTKGQILSVRYPVNTPYAGTGTTGTLNLANSAGGNIGVLTRISLSPTPGDMTGGGKIYCVNESAMVPTVSTGTKPANCPIDRTKQMYYLNIEVQQSCSGSSCIFHISENTKEFR